MSNRPIPRKGLLGCWFLDDRGIAYNAGANEAKDRSGRGNHATYKNGVTVGVEGDPAREFGASGFDAGSNQFADVGDPLAVDGPQATVVIGRVDAFTDDARLVETDDRSDGFSISIDDSESVIQGFIRDAGGGPIIVDTSKFELDTYFSVTLFFDGSTVGLFFDSELVDTTNASSVSAGGDDLRIGEDVLSSSRHLDGEIAAVARYDLTVPNAPEPSEIARKWDKLRDIPATR